MALLRIQLLMWSLKRKASMGSEDNRMMEEALNDLRKLNDALRYENKELKKFLEYINGQITSFVTKGNSI